jgi:hypothetical protein
MSNKRPISLALALLALLPAAASVPLPAGAVQGQYPERPRNSCNIGGWSVDPDPAGQNVRAGPSVQARVVGRLAPYAALRGGPVGPYGSTFAIIAASNGWFYIDTVSNPVIRGGRVDYVTSPVRGWINSRFIQFTILSEVGFAEPSTRARQVWTGDPRPAVARLIDCRGEWARVRLQHGGRNAEPWFRGICGAPDFCEGVMGDRRR